MYLRKLTCTENSLFYRKPESANQFFNAFSIKISRLRSSKFPSRKIPRDDEMLPGLNGYLLPTESCTKLKWELNDSERDALFMGVAGIRADGVLNAMVSFWTEANGNDRYFEPVGPRKIFFFANAPQTVALLCVGH